MTIPVGEFGAVIGRCSTPVGGEHNKRKGGLAMRKSRKIAIVAGSTVGALAIGGVAFAYWTQGGSGTGTGAAGTTTAITVNQTTTPAGLYPGGPAASLAGNFDNPNPGAVNISGITAAVTSVTGGGTDSSKPACTTDDFLIGGSSGANVVPAGNGLGSWTGLTLQLVDNGLNQDNCKNAVAHVTYTVVP